MEFFLFAVMSTIWPNLIHCVKLRKSPLEPTKIDIYGTASPGTENHRQAAHYGACDPGPLNEVMISAKSEPRRRNRYRNGMCAPGTLMQRTKHDSTEELLLLDFILQIN